MYRFEEIHRRLGLGIGHFRVFQLSSLLRQVDDGAIAAPNHCLACVLRFLRRCWGNQMSLSTEESGATIKFADLLETYQNGQFSYSMYHKNSPLPPRYNPLLTRFNPFSENLHPIPYVRSLVSCYLHRSSQIHGEGSHLQITYDMWELIRELQSPPLSYPVPVIIKALHGFRKAWASDILKPTRAVLEALAPTTTHI